MTLLMFICGYLLYSMGYGAYIVGVCIGILLVSFSDLQGSFRHRTIAMLLSILVNSITMIIMNVLQHDAWFQFLYVIVATFLLSFISVFGNRATFFSLSGLLGLVFSYIESYQGIDLWYFLVIFVSGALIYVIWSSIYHWLSRKSQMIEKLGELTELTANYLYQRSERQESNFDQQTSLLDTQTQVLQEQEHLREIILSGRKIGGQSHTRNRNMLLLIELIDIMELAIANPTSLQKVKIELLDVDPSIYQPFSTLAHAIARQLSNLSSVLLFKKKRIDVISFSNLIDKCELAIQEYVRVKGLPEARNVAIHLRNYLDYLTLQSSHIRSIERLCFDVEKQRNLALSSRQQSQFLPDEDYSWQVLQDNFTMKSPGFRHAIRLTIAVFIGYMIGIFLAQKNAYWILLTVIVIMRPSYGLTKERSLKRVLGTLFGVLLGIGLIQISTHIVFSLSIIAFSMFFAFSIIQRNYFLAAAGITLNVIFVFSLLHANKWEVITLRVLDTTIGAAVSMFVVYFIIPYWEQEQIQEALTTALKSNRDFLFLLSQTSFDSISETNFRLQRKQAFSGTTELTMSFQRYILEPKSKQVQLSTYYELVCLNQAMISSIANLGNFIKNREIESKEIFKTACIEYANQIDQLIKNIESKSNIERPSQNEQIKVLDLLHKAWQQLENQRNQEISEGKTKISSTSREQFKELQLLIEEFRWLEGIIRNMFELISTGKSIAKTHKNLKNL